MNTKTYLHFTKDEDSKIISLFEESGIKKWNEIAKYLPNRSGKNCRDRYMNHLKQNFETENWFNEDDDNLFKLVAKYGRKWLKISKHFPGKTLDSIKKRFHQILSNQNGKENFHSKKNKVRTVRLVFPPNFEENQLSNININMKFVNLYDQIIQDKFFETFENVVN
jgi:N-glycosylase/DNA lyase